MAAVVFIAVALCFIFLGAETAYRLTRAGRERRWMSVALFAAAGLAMLGVLFVWYKFLL